MHVPESGVIGSSKPDDQTCRFLEDLDCTQPYSNRSNCEMFMSGFGEEGKDSGWERNF